MIARDLISILEHHPDMLVTFFSVTELQFVEVSGVLRETNVCLTQRGEYVREEDLILEDDEELGVDEVVERMDVLVLK